ncbi:2-succinyl-5-enolpyruvyl-6-hydroxy-3-cyclohexene-1-carboxylic-acid synthase [Sporosarcina sp. P37]|uniref:2-succinyl-5-enolpyruvyl-6-hydroxy-3- cyclohexene-1-carboxylic-acid synthase n=1 Tax=unclassified Sporosarcina TaxID=2647733 RepID=UPI0009BCB53D|nr:MULTISPECIES: 2-succinyl-5-enolpyruvyl-6-hydroxy-3-cyclohexene-1-carboxylic-acid synthase [unclassified Sporosarcina]ARD47411.1 2-succinyl-5-enolpyruvyl-6-hydroxy-3-cyclohexene-1-carboxylate synthase [Sporosarcina sp. P33]ARK23981.1 2-succinyl-5-enolpyruvyl-6-hydroxy-3-cyclohexene-1-carboxylic-acid synthase [Sporosarcina sp. P37]PID16280.1 2-succinyl-5-enolpyruvyl-6-hydroxy-3-cyclohexene-1-carboxylic-acid synthase [Sporosarcina sp. P35]
MNDHETGLTNYVLRLTSVLLRQGANKAVISPGSRSTPLAYALTASKDMQTYIHTDERSAAFYALGLVKATGKPVVLLCTSGTAASNYHPAVTEAFYARLPLIVITADRPHELREVGAPQAIDQIRMFGEHVKESVDFPIPEHREDILRYMEQRAFRLLSVAKTAPKGPVHMNIPFREPLLIDLEAALPETRVQQQLAAELAVTDEMKQLLHQAITSSVKGIIVVGEQPPTLCKDLFWKFAKALQWPVLCDPLSNLRSQVPEDCLDLCIDQYDALLKSEVFSARVQPDCVIRFGPQPVSKPLLLFLQKSCPKTYIVVDDSPNYRDPIGLTTHHLQASDASVWQQALMERERTSYTQRWVEANHISAEVMNEDKQFAGDEGHFVRQFIANLPDGSDVVCSSSMPIRDLDTHFQKTGRDISLFCNRGTNGIDGVVSTALGIQEGRKRKTYLLIGDLAFLHDINGLIISRLQQTDLTIVLINNNGGGIFSYLPQASVEMHYEQLFGTPTNLKFGHLAAMYEAQYDEVNTIEAFERTMQAEKNAALRMIEVETVRADNVEAHRAVWREIARRVERVGN